MEYKDGQFWDGEWGLCIEEWGYLIGRMGKSDLRYISIWKDKIYLIINRQGGFFVGGLDIFLWGIGNYQLGMACGITGGGIYTIQELNSSLVCLYIDTNYALTIQRVMLLNLTLICFYIIMLCFY